MGEFEQANRSPLRSKNGIRHRIIVTFFAVGLRPFANLQARRHHHHSVGYTLNAPVPGPARPDAGKAVRDIAAEPHLGMLATGISFLANATMREFRTAVIRGGRSIECCDHLTSILTVSVDADNFRRFDGICDYRSRWRNP